MQARSSGRAEWDWGKKLDLTALAVRNDGGFKELSHYGQEKKSYVFIIIISVRRGPWLT